MSHDVTKSGYIGKSLISVGRFTYGHENITVKQWNEGAGLKIGGFCSIAANVTIFLGGNHRSDWISTFPFGHLYPEELGGQGIVGHPGTKGDVIIGNDVWLGHGSTIMSGVKIGHGAIIGTNALVVKDVAPYEIVGGNPAKHLKMRFSDEVIALLLKLEWWDLPVAAIRELCRELSAAPNAALIQSWIEKYRPERLNTESPNQSAAA